MQGLTNPLHATEETMQSRQYKKHAYPGHLKRIFPRLLNKIRKLKGLALITRANSLSLNIVSNTPTLQFRALFQNFFLRNLKCCKKMLEFLGEGRIKYAKMIGIQRTLWMYRKLWL